MRIETIDGTTHIYVERDETEQTVLRSIAKASFELSRPAGMGFLHFDAGAGEMTDEQADQFINLKSAYGVLEMDYVGGRQCKTYISKKGDGHFTLNNFLFERDRGDVTPLFDRAQEILSGARTVGPMSDNGLKSTAFMYEGDSLTKRLKEHGFDRQNGEGDWDFRKRTFPGMMHKDEIRALEFLLGCSAPEWNSTDKILAQQAKDAAKAGEEKLQSFLKRFEADPLIRRKRKQAAPTN